MKQGIRFGGQILGYYAMLIVLCLLFIMNIGDDTYWLQALLNAALLFGIGSLMYNAGGYRGERAVSLLHSTNKRREEGHAADPEQLAQAWNKNTAWIAFLTAALPLLLIAAVNLIYMPIYEAKLATLPPIVQSEQQAAEDTQSAVPDVTADPGLQPVDVSEPEPEATYSSEYVNWPQIVARIAFMPFVALYSPLANNLALLNALFLPLALLLPACGAAGYLMGPKLHQKKLAEIAKGSRRKRRNLRVQKKNTPRRQKPEV